MPGDIIVYLVKTHPHFLWLKQNLDRFHPLISQIFDAFIDLFFFGLESFVPQVFPFWWNAATEYWPHKWHFFPSDAPLSLFFFKEEMFSFW